MSRQPAISIVIPTHNRADRVRRAVDSVLSQSIDDFALIVVDDASTDETPAVLSEYVDSRLRVVRNKENVGAAASRNRGVGTARSEFVTFLDDDDRYYPGFLEAVVTETEGCPAAVAFGWCGTRVVDDRGWRRVDEERLWLPRFESRPEAYLGFLQYRGVGTNCGLAVRRRAFESLGGFDVTLRKAEDTDLLIRFALNYDYFVIPETLVEVHYHRGPRLTTYDNVMAEAYQRIIAKHDARLANAHPEILAQLQYKLAWLYYHAGRKQDARKALAVAQGALRPQWKSTALRAMFEFLPKGVAARLHAALSSARAWVAPDPTRNRGTRVPGD